MNVRTKLDEKYKIRRIITGNKAQNPQYFYDVHEIGMERR